MVELQQVLQLEIAEKSVAKPVMELLKLETLGYPSEVHVHPCLEMLQQLEHFFYPLKFSKDKNDTFRAYCDSILHMAEG